MFERLHKTSLRTRLILLTAVSIIALLVALVSAWRTAQMSGTFARRQAESSVSNAVRELLREARDYPFGRNDSSAIGKKPLLPHERDIFARYGDPFARSSAIALHRFPETAGVFCTADGDTQGLTVADNFGAILTAQEREAIENVCRQIPSMRDFSTQQIAVGNKTLLVSAAPISFETSDSPSGSISGAVAFRRWQPPSGFSDWFSLLTQGFLLVSVVGLAIFSFLTWRDWQNGMWEIEHGLRKIAGDLRARINPPPMPELDKMSDSINDLAANLDANLRRQKELEQSLTQNEKLVALGRVIAGVAHEVRNPLASMKLKIQLAERNKFESAKVEKTFDVLQEEIERLDNLVKKLLDVSRPAKLNFSDFSLTELIEQRLSLLAEKAAAQNARFEFDKPLGNGEIRADRERLAQVFDNIFRNALEAMPGGGIIKVSLEEKPDVYRIRISDIGGGFSPEERERLFEPFFTTKDEGTGLGLAISREITEAHGGKIYLLDSTEGATFVIELPRKELTN
ncbi:MAG: two-component system sensor histidine kinase NtrB [Pyrinomonadaceae bacterium]